MEFTLIDKQLNEWQNYVIIGLKGKEELSISYDISGIEINWEYETGDDFNGRVFNGLNNFQLENECFTLDGEKITEEVFFEKAGIENSDIFFKELKEFIKKEIAKIIEANPEDFE